MLLLLRSLTEESSAEPERAGTERNTTTREQKRARNVSGKKAKDKSPRGSLVLYPLLNGAVEAGDGHFSCFPRWACHEIAVYVNVRACVRVFACVRGRARTF